MRKCSKCGADNPLVKFIASGETVYGKMNNEFYSYTYDNLWTRSRKDHLKLKCSVCDYIWYEDTLDSKE